MSEQNTFDSGREIVIKIPVPGGMKTANLRFPTDIEWAERASAQRVVIREIGRDQTITETSGAEAADLALFEQIRQDADEPWDKYEAAVALSKLSRAIAGRAEMDGENYRISLTVPGALTTHVLKVPSLAQMSQYRRASAQAIDGRHGLTTIRVKLQPAGELYDALVVSSEGYVSAVPIVHKVAVVNELLREIDALIEGDGQGF